MVGAFDRGADSALFTLAQAADLAGVSRGTVRAWCLGGKVPSVAGPRRGERLVHRDAIEAHLASATHAPRSVRQRAAAPSDPRTEMPPADAPGRAKPPKLRLIRERLASGDALRRIAAEVRGPMDLPTLFDDVIEDSLALFSVDRVGLWLYDGSQPRP